MNTCTPHTRQNASPETVTYKGPDRLSVLPDDLLVKILSSLKPKEVARTCILSKRWLKIWSFVPSLCFDTADFLDKDAWKITDDTLEKFLNFVSSFLLRRDEASHVHTFQLLCNAYDLKCQQGYVFSSEKTAASTREWVLYALKHNPKILQVSFSGEYSANLPDCLFTCETLEDVNLCFKTRNKENIEPKRVCLPSLRNLILSGLDLSDDYPETFLSGCPVLESLRIKDCTMHNFSSHTLKRLELLGAIEGTVTISAPAVEFLYFDGIMDTEITIKDASKVTRATLLSPNFSALNYKCSFLSSLSNVEDLVLNIRYLKGMLERELPKCPTFFSLRKLILGEFCMVCVLDVLSSFLDHCPKLEKLTLLHNECLEAVGYHSGEESDEHSEQIKGFPCKRLETVKIIYYESDCDVHRLYQHILQRTNHIRVRIILTEYKSSEFLSAIGMEVF